MKKRRVLKTIMLCIIMVVLLAVLAVLALVLSFIYKHGDKWKQLKDSALAIAAASEREDFCTALTSTVYYDDGSVITSLKAEKDVYYLKYEEIPKMVVKSFVSVEDKRFYRHKGVDYIAIMRAAWSLYRNKAITQGGSTITQQLGRNVYLSQEVSWERKIEEMFLARGLEKKYSKEDILEFYINNIYFANGNYGIQSAARGYFQKDISELSLSETVFLCAIPNNPEKYDPLTNMENTISRRNQMLDIMYERGILDKEDYKKALIEKIVLNPEKTEKHNFVETFVFECATDILMKDGISHQEALMGLYTKGYSIYTSINSERQEQLQRALDAELAEFTETNDEGTFKMQGSAVCIDNGTGRVIAIVGGRSQSTEGYTLNRAFQSYRQPGSAIKPLIIYTPLFSDGYTPNTIVSDKKFEGGPSNADKRYSGDITVRDAVAYSKNTVAWKLFSEITAQKGLQYLLDMNFKKIVAQDYVPAASLGGLTYGVSALEMTSAYAAIENEGMYRNPNCITKITDHNGNVIYQASDEEKEIYSGYASVVMTDVLKSVLDYGTGKQAKLENMSCAGKTGTTNNSKDGWFVGYTAYYTTGVWIGYDIPEEIKDLNKEGYPLKIWKSYMQELHRGLEDIAFKTPKEYLVELENKQKEKDDEKNNEEETTSSSVAPSSTQPATPASSEKSTTKAPLHDAGVDWEDDIRRRD